MNNQLVIYTNRALIHSIGDLYQPADRFHLNVHYQAYYTIASLHDMQY